jgi:hypothetical protein
MARPSSGRSPPHDGPIGIGVTRPADGRPGPKRLTCTEKNNRCRVAVDGGHRLTVQWGSVPLSVVEKVARSVVAVTETGSAATWLTPDEAFPTSALLTMTR